MFRTNKGLSQKNMTNIAYVMGEFPAPTEFFVLREIIALRQAGLGIYVLALKRGTSRIPYKEARNYLHTVYWSLGDEKRISPRFLKHFSAKATKLLSEQNSRKIIRALGTAVPSPVLSPRSWLRGLRNLVIATDFVDACTFADIKHVHAHFACLPADVGLTMAELLGVGFSFSAHAWDIYTQDRNYLLKKVKKANFVACCSIHGLEHLRRMFPEISPDKFVLVHHGLLMEDFIPPCQPMDRNLPVIAGVGRLEPKKGFIHLIRACAILAERELQFLCRIAGEGSLRQSLECEIKHLGLDGKVELMGYLSLEGVRKLLKQASVFVMPSVHLPNGDCDGIPNAMLEAMALGTPVVATSAGGIPEVIKDGINGLLVNPSSPVLLADTIQRLLTNEQMRITIGQAGRQTVFEQFYAPQNIIPLTELFRTAIFQTQRQNYKE
jgi:glycosyltransferase involved in cell wall biosynthesis